MYGGSISGSVAGLSVNGNYDRTEYFSGATDPTVTGGTPRVTVARNETPAVRIAGLLLDERGVRQPGARDAARDSVVTRPRAHAARRDARHPRPVHEAPVPDGELVGGLARHLLDPQPAARRQRRRGRPEHLAHLLRLPGARHRPGLQPRLEHARTAGTPRSGSTRSSRSSPSSGSRWWTTSTGSCSWTAPTTSLGGTTRVDYGMTNRVLAKRKGGGGSSAREILGVVDRPDLLLGRPGQPVRPELLDELLRQRADASSRRSAWTLRATPTDQVNGAFRMEYDANRGRDPEHRRRRPGPRDASGCTSPPASASGAWRAPSTSPPGCDNYIVAAATLQVGRPTGSAAPTRSTTTSAASTLLTSRIIGYYNAQCCGFAVEYQTYNFPQGTAGFPVAKDRRFNFSFTLAGLGTFSNFFGALGGSGLQ